MFEENKKTDQLAVRSDYLYNEAPHAEGSDIDRKAMKLMLLSCEKLKQYAAQMT